MEVDVAQANRQSQGMSKGNTTCYSYLLDFIKIIAFILQNDKNHASKYPDFQQRIVLPLLAYETQNNLAESHKLFADNETKQQFLCDCHMRSLLLGLPVHDSFRDNFFSGDRPSLRPRSQSAPAIVFYSQDKRDAASQTDQERIEGATLDP